MKSRTPRLILLALGGTLVGLLGLSLPGLGALGEPSLALGQDSAHPPASAAGSKAAKGRRAEAPHATPDIEEDEEGEDQDVDAQSEVRSEKGAKVKVIRFSGLDLAGRLKSPQLLYFLSRMRTEFDRPRLSHRSFMPELQRSTKGKSF